MGQSMVAIVQDDCTGCDLCITHCPFEALLPLAVNPEGRTKAKRPVVVVEAQCVGCLSCIGSCPTDALHEISVPVSTEESPLLNPSQPPLTEKVVRWKKRANRWA
ncbi:MAG: 4Fe-4S binding protein [Candidatus Poseidonia sp.]|nr:4Fe-4S binding protein [Poseidonia sp.]